MQKIELGRRYTDKITGFAGVATGYVEYLTGCNQVLLAPPVAPDGSLRESNWFDQQRLELETESDAIVLDNGATPGSDKAAPKR